MVHGTCMDEGNVLTCECDDGFSGDACETDLEFCITDSCMNGGTCVEGLGTATSCNCTDGFSVEMMVISVNLTLA